MASPWAFKSRLQPTVLIGSSIQVIKTTVVENRGVVFYVCNCECLCVCQRSICANFDMQDVICNCEVVIFKIILTFRYLNQVCLIFFFFLRNKET